MPEGKHTPMTKADASRIQSANDKKGADMGKGSFPAKAQSAADKNMNTGAAEGGKQSGDHHDKK